MAKVTLFLTYLLAINFIIKPRHSLVQTLNCFNCKSDHSEPCFNGDGSSPNKMCNNGEYCFKNKLFEDSVEYVDRGCYSRISLLDNESPLNECEKSVYGGDICFCDQNDCNSGNDFNTTHTTTPALNCLKCKATGCLDDSTSALCKKGYYCYKLSKQDEIERGCVHKGFTLNLEIKINECGELFEDYGDKYPICICDNDNCNSGHLPSTTTTIGTTVKSTNKPPQPSSSSAENSFKQISLILIWMSFSI